MALDPAILDRCLKVLTRRAYPAVFRLFGVEVAPAHIHFEDVALNLPEHRADDLMVVQTRDPTDRWALLLEIQTRPDPSLLRSWRYKAAAAEKVLDCPVLLSVLYLERGEYATFPNREEIRGGSLRNTYEFETVQLWEHAERIANGDLPELAPVLLLASEEKSEAVLQRERELILNLPATPEQRRDLLALATMVGRRYFSDEVLRHIFRQEMVMLKQVDFIQEWIDEGRNEGLSEGEARGARAALVRLLRIRFGALAPDTEARIAELTAEQALDLVERAEQASSLAELGF